MFEVNKLLKDCDIKPLNYLKKGNVFIISTKDNKYVVKKTKKEIYKYIAERNYHNYPNIIYLDDYIIYEYADDLDIPNEQKILDLIFLVSLLHKKTSYNKNICENDIKEIYEGIINDINYLRLYYDSLMTNIESMEIMSPAEYYLARNITLVYKVLNESEKRVNDWYSNNKDKTSWRVCLNHNNLKIDHLINNNIISFEKAYINLPIYDLYKLYKETYYINNWYDLINKYEKEYPLLDYEKELLIILILLPNKIEFTNKEYDNTILISKEIEYLNSSLSLIDKLTTKK